MTRSGSMSQALPHSATAGDAITAAGHVAGLDFEVRDRPRDAIPHLGARQLDGAAVLEADKRVIGSPASVDIASQSPPRKRSSSTSGSPLSPLRLQLAECLKRTAVGAHTISRVRFMILARFPLPFLILIHHSVSTSASRYCLSSFDPHST
jgi:hypothetical protein